MCKHDPKAKLIQKKQHEDGNIVIKCYDLVNNGKGFIFKKNRVPLTAKDM